MSILLPSNDVRSSESCDFCGQMMFIYDDRRTSTRTRSCNHPSRSTGRVLNACGSNWTQVIGKPHEMRFNITIHNASSSSSPTGASAILWSSGQFTTYVESGCSLRSSRRNNVADELQDRIDTDVTEGRLETISSIPDWLKSADCKLSDFRRGYLICPSVRRRTSASAGIWPIRGKHTIVRYSSSGLSRLTRRSCKADTSTAEIFNERSDGVKMRDDPGEESRSSTTSPMR